MEFEGRRYFDDPYRTEFAAVVAAVEPAGEGALAVYLAETYFYPDSGGQPADGGTLGGFPVIAVTEDERGVRHTVKNEAVDEVGRIASAAGMDAAATFTPGARVAGVVDRSRRLDHMRQHTGQHLLSRVFLDECRLKTVSFHLGDDACTIDLEGRAPTVEDLERVESIANELVLRNISVACRIVDGEELGEIAEGADAGVDILRSRLPGGLDRIRLVEIEGVDRCTCCGTHVRSTGEIGPVKILRQERMKGNTRIEFLCGERAVRDYAAKHRLVAGLAGRFSTDWREVGKVVEKLVEEGKELRKRGDELRRELAGYKAADFAAPTSSVGGLDIVKRVFTDADQTFLRETANKIREKPKMIVLFGASGPSPALVFACSSGIHLDMGLLMKSAAPIVGARGGGGRDFAQGGGGDGARVAEALEEAERLFRKAIA